MMINCPKCKFNQPEDQYCAQCGVNMVTYVPPKKPIFTRIINNTYVQVGSIGLATTMAILAIMYKPHEAQMASYLKGSGPKKIRANAFLGNEDAPNIQPDQAGNDSTNPTGMNQPLGERAVGSAGPALAATATGTPEAAALAAKEAGKDAVAKAGAPVPLLNPQQVKITYAEVTQRGYEMLTEESRSSGQFNSFADYSAGVIPNVSKKLQQLPRDFRILSSETVVLNSGKPLQAFLSHKDRTREPASAEVQLATNINLDASDAANLRADVEVLKTGKDATARANYPASFDVMTDTGYFMSGFHAGQSEREADQAFQTELIVLVEFTK
ncbi:MAG: hypothetical protein V4736_13985 [Bdellovibrionota bacterium]